MVAKIVTSPLWPSSRDEANLVAAVNLTAYSYRFAAEVLNSPGFKKERRDIEGIFSAIVVPQLKPPKLRTRGGKTMTFTTAQKDLNVLLNDEFKKKGWDCQPYVTEDKVTGIKADYKKAGVQVEVQFGNMARW